MSLTTTLPVLVDYAAPVPPRADLPSNRADWDLDPARAAVLVHDFQHYFLRPFDPACPALRQALDATARVLRAARAVGVPVFYTAQTGTRTGTERGLQADLWGPGMDATPEHTDIEASVAPVVGDTVLEKHRYSAFARSDLQRRLADAGRNQLVLTGVYAHIGVTATALDAFQVEVQPFLVADAVADLGEEQHRRALQQVAGCCGMVVRADDVTSAFAAGGCVGLEASVRSALTGVLGADTAASVGTGDDLFAHGLDSVRAFAVLDELVGVGIDVDFGEFVREPTISFLVAARGQR